MGVKYTQKGDKYFFACPVHGGDNQSGATIFAHDKPNWKCWTHECHNKYGSSLYQFVRGFLSREREASKNDVFRFLDGKIALETKLINIEAIQKLNITNIFCISPSDEVIPKYRPKLLIPSPYFVGRGFLPETLQLFGVGDCYDNSPMSNRAVVPIYCSESKLKGYTGRTLINDQQKWKNSYGLAKTNHLYGYNFAKSHILDTGTAIIVEGPANVWRLWEAGYCNSVGIMGAYLSDYQLILLERSGAFHLTLLNDMDEAGRKGVESIKEMCGRRFTYSVPEYDKEDPAEMNVNELKLLLGNQ